MDENLDVLGNAADAAAVRREARIKRILGNSKNRLNKIAGREENANGKRKLF